ncbi:formate hydrogenlyase, putative [Babesia ovata]|uniref:Formate hydrogenlyase, putative n=1 Tax=Babesia ovata TaxID=189622 RepID=A0A2H6KGW6_9APIC|nr:formate hydrogenlyase, putative [Babesia ovata]GBE62238.1 formate hydrogenlyase, putative [Babesia ovata]
MKEDNPQSSDNPIAEPEDAEGAAEEISMEELMGSIMKGVSKAFSTTTANKSRGVSVTCLPINTLQPVKSAVPEAPKPPKRSVRVSIRKQPDEFPEADEQRYKKIANNGVVRLFELINQS